MKLIIDYPWYYVLLCLLVGAAYAFVLYRRNSKKTDDGMSKWMTALLAALRFLAVATIAFLLLSPLVKRETARKEKPIVILLEDNSQSLNLCHDSAYYNTTFQQEMDKLATDLSKDYDIRRYHYGSSVTELCDDIEPSLFTDTKTDMAAAIDEVAERYYHRNVGAIILTSDGIYNQGSSPLTTAERASIPIYTVAMGDTTVYPDAAIANVRCNRVAYLGNKFPMDITVNASRLDGKEAVLNVSCDGKKLVSRNISINGNHFSINESIVLDADREGLRNYIVEIVPIKGEKTTRNNRRTIPVEVIDGRQKVAIIAAVPHPDIAALRTAVESNLNCEAEVFMAKDFKANVNDYNLLILHQLPTKVTESNIDVGALLKSGTPAIFVLGSQSDISRFNALHAGLEIYSRIERQSDATPLPNSDFTFFTLDDDMANRIAAFPPLLTPFGEYKLAGNAQTLMHARIGTVNSKQPLIAMAQMQNRRYSFIAGEGLWRWRMADFQSNGNHNSFDQLVNKIMVFTALRVGKERFHVEVERLFGPDDPVTMEAQLFNDNYEAVNSPEVRLTLHSDGRDDANYLFNRSGLGYTINLGALPAGTYRYVASTNLSGKEYSASGSFVVEEQNLEAVVTVADHALMNTLAAATGASMVEAHNVASLADIIRDRDDMRTVIYSETRYSDMLNMPLLLILIILLLTAEWVLRKLVNGDL